MFFSIITIFSLLIFASTNDENNNRRIFRQQQLYPPQYMAAIFVNDKPVCGGAFIRNDHVITAADCVHGKTNIVVAVNSVKPNEMEKKNAKQFYVHPYYRPSLKGYNVAVVKVDAFPDPVILKLANTEPKPGQVLLTSSWNPESEEQRFESEESIVIERSHCKKSLAAHVAINGKLICMNMENSKLPFYNGNPLAFVDPDDNDIKILFGVGTYAVKNSTENLPNIYVNVANFEIESFLQTFV